MTRGCRWKSTSVPLSPGGRSDAPPARSLATVRQVAHQTSITVRFADLDPYDHVNHARYLTYFESARIEMLEAVGYPMTRMKRDGFQIVLVEVHVRFHTAAGLHDRVSIVTELLDVRRASTSWRQEARVDDRLVATLEATAAFTDPNGRPIRPPEGFAAAVARGLDPAASSDADPA